MALPQRATWGAVVIAILLISYFADIAEFFSHSTVITVIADPPMDTANTETTKSHDVSPTNKVPTAPSPPTYPFQIHHDRELSRVPPEAVQPPAVSSLSSPTHHPSANQLDLLMERIAVLEQQNHEIAESLRGINSAQKQAGFYDFKEFLWIS